MAEKTTTEEPPLDWSIHCDGSRWPVSTKTFLAEALLITGKTLCVPWDGSEPASMCHPKRSPVPSAHEAFNGGKPVAAVHAAFGAEIRAFMSPAEYLLGLINENPEAWHQGQLPYPADASLAALELRARNKEDQDDPITPRHWETAACQINSEYGQREDAVRALPIVAKHIVSLAVTGRVRTYARPLGGGAMVELEPSLWELDEPLARAAVCSLNIDDPFNQKAPPTHFIFVEREDLEQALAGLTPADKLYLIKDLEGGDREGPYAGAVEDLTDWICARAVEPQYSYFKDWRRGRWEDAAAVLGSWATGPVFEDAWSAATKLHPHLSKVGRPRKDEDPSPVPDRSNIYDFPSKNPRKNRP